MSDLVEFGDAVADQCDALARSALLVGCLGLLLPAIAVAETYSPNGVHDNAKMFGEKAVKTATEMIDAIKRDYKKDVCIETFPKLLPDLQKEFDAADNKRQFWADLADKRYEKHDVKGVYLLIVEKPPHYQFGVGRLEKTKAFTSDDRKKAEAILKENLEAKTFDKGLLAVVNDIDLTLNRTVGKAKTSSTAVVPPSTKPSSPTKSSIPEVPGMFSGILGIVCIGLVVILALWVVIGVFRALTGGGNRPVDRAPYGGQGGGGYGQQGGGGYAPQQGGGGGGGFLKGMLGGMLGAAGGMFLYDRFFGGGHSPMGGGGMTPTAYGGTAPVDNDDRMGDTGGGDYNAGGAKEDAGGGDWGKKDDDGGGGSFGGGGDDGGGGSFGGGDDGGGGSFGGGDGGGGGDW